jgi:hypothetical protein
MRVIEYCLNFDLKSARRFSEGFSVYINSGCALVIGSLHYMATGIWLYSILLAGLYYWYRFILKRLSIEMEKNYPAS